LPQKEIEHYKSVNAKVRRAAGFRHQAAKTDWSLWIATRAESTATSRRSSRNYDYLDRLVGAFLWWIVCDQRHRSSGMHARPVVGASSSSWLADRRGARNGRAGQAKVGDRAPLPPKPEVTEVVAYIAEHAGQWRYHHQRRRWTRRRSAIKIGPRAGGFGSPARPDRSPDEVDEPATLAAAGDHDACRRAARTCSSTLSHEDVEIYVNGRRAVGGFITSYDGEMTEAARAQLKR